MRIIIILAVLSISLLSANYSRWIGCWTQQGKAMFYLAIEDKKWLAEYSLNNKIIPKNEAKYLKTTYSKKTGNLFDHYKDEKLNTLYIFQRSVMKGYSNTLEIFKKTNQTRYLCEDLK